MYRVTRLQPYSAGWNALKNGASNVVDLKEAASAAAINQMSNTLENMSNSVQGNEPVQLEVVLTTGMLTMSMRKTVTPQQKT